MNKKMKIIAITIISLIIFSTFASVLASGVDDSYTKALLHFEGADASTTFTDESGKTWTRSGDAQIDTAQYYFGSASGLFDGTGDYITTPDSDDFYLSADYTIDFRVRFNTLPGSGSYIGFFTQYQDTNNKFYATIANSSGSYAVHLYMISASTLLKEIDYNVTVSTGTWYHFAFARSGSTYYFFQNGTHINGSESGSGGAWPNLSSVLYIGTYHGTGNYLDGWVDEFRFTNGISRWTGDFSTPAQQYDPTSTTTATFTPSDTPTNTATFTPTFTPSVTPTNTATFTPTFTPSDTPTITATFTPTFTPSDTPTITATFTLTPSLTPTSTSTQTFTPSPTTTATNTPTQTFTPVSTATTGSGNTKVLLHFDGEDASTVFTDESGKTWTASGNAELDTNISMFGSASGYFGGVGDYIFASNIDLGTGDWTIEFWFLNDGLDADQTLCGQLSVLGILIDDENYPVVHWFDLSETPGQIVSDTAITGYMWHHLAVVLNDDTITMYLDGLSVGSAEISGLPIMISPPDFRIGSDANNPDVGMVGWIDEFRLSDVARYTENFTPPGAPFEFDAAPIATNTPTPNATQVYENWAEIGKQNIPVVTILSILCGVVLVVGIAAIILWAFTRRAQ
jgi:hypothetical protein